MRIGQFVNTGVQLDAGDTNTFFGCSWEGVNTQGGLEPNDPPVAIKIPKSSLNSSGADNNGNEFFGAKFEGNTWDAINDNSYTVFHGNDFTDIPTMKRYGVGGLATPLILGGESAGGYTNGAGKCCNQIDHGCVSKLAELTNNSCA